MEKTYIEDIGNMQLLKFTKMEEFKEKVELVITLKTYNKGFKRDKNGKIISEKYECLAKYLNVDNENIIKPIQNHTDNILCVKEKKNNKLLNVDGTITNKRKIGLASTFADCIPIFFYDPIKNVIANIHSGWLGTVKEISLKALSIMLKEFECKVNNIIVLIGPCIRKDHFLVNEDVKIIFEEKFSEICNKCDIIRKTEKYNEKGVQYVIDTVEINKEILKNHKILEKNIIDSNICTVCQSKYFHSRRAEGIEYDLNTGIIMLK